MPILWPNLKPIWHPRVYIYLTRLRGVRLGHHRPDCLQICTVKHSVTQCVIPVNRYRFDIAGVSWRDGVYTARVSGLASKWVRLVGSKLGQIRDLFRSDFRTFWLAKPKYTEIYSEKSQICPFWGQSGPLYNQSWHSRGVCVYILTVTVYTQPDFLITQQSC